MEPVEIWFKIEKDSDGYPEAQDWEELWAYPIVEGGHFRVESVAFFVKDIARGDIVSAGINGEGWLCFEKVISRSGNSNFRILLADSIPYDREEVVRILNELGGCAEVAFDLLVAVDVPAISESRVWQYLQSGHQRGDWGLQVGFSPET